MTVSGAEMNEKPASARLTRTSFDGSTIITY